MSRFSSFAARFGRLLPAALIAGLALGAAIEANAVVVTTATWNSANSGSWQTGTNWIGNTAPTGGESLVFGSAGGATSRTATNNTAGFSVAGITFGGTTAFLLSGSSIQLSGTIENTTNPRQQNINIPITLTGTSTIMNDFGMGFGQPINNAGNNVLVVGSGTTTFSQAMTGAGNLTVNPGASVIYNGATMGGNLVVNGDIRIGATSLITTTVSSNMTIGSTGDVTMAVGSVGGSIIDPPLSGQSYDQFKGAGNVTFNGTLSLDFASLFDGSSTLDPDLVTNYTTRWELFDFGTYSGNFTNVDGFGAPAGWTAVDGTWTQGFQNSWESPVFNTAGQYLAFDQATGVLMVVPEPSAVMIAGLGVALAGWRLSRNRKAKKAAAVKA